MNLAIVKYNAGNIFSVECALRRLGVEATLTDDPTLLRRADKVIFPGVGEAATTMQHLRQHGLDEVIRSLRQPVLGICLGMQLMCRHSDEGDVPCLGIFETDVKRFQPKEGEKVPHMGWNTLSHLRGPLFQGMTPEEYVYFVHSYYVPVNDGTAAQADYILPFSAALQKDNFFATQFHPEKSGAAGERILRNFLEL
jgi:glutamine amidotransferase